MNIPYQATDGPAPSQRQLIRIAQIITFALIQGGLIFGAILLFMNGARIDGKASLLTWVAMGFSGLMVVIHFIMPKIIAGMLLSRLTSESLKDTSDDWKFAIVVQIFQMQHIIACAILEGAVFLSLFAYMIEKSGIALCCAAGLLFLMALRFPTTSHVQFWVEDKVREIELR
jgi:hypothetical protein